MGHVGNEIAESGTDALGLRALPIGIFIAEADGTAWMQTSYDFQIPGALRTGIELLRNRGTADLGGRPRDGVDRNTRQHRQFATQREQTKPRPRLRGVTRSRRTEAGPHAAVGLFFVNPKTESHPPQVGT
ncbi:MAG: hypothetical protein K0Q61_551 [Rhodococcus erythropolis]|nr:hypothetical protein [Rhodococcus erythropolis]